MIRIAARVVTVEAALTLAMQRYLRDLHEGRVDPRQLGQAYAPPRREPFDAVAALQNALAERRLAEAVRDVASRSRSYCGTRSPAIARSPTLAGRLALASLRGAAARTAGKVLGLLAAR